MPVPQQYPLTRRGFCCPFCLEPKQENIIAHWGACYRESGFKEGELKAEAVVEAYERYLEALKEWEER